MKWRSNSCYCLYSRTYCDKTEGTKRWSVKRRWKRRSLPTVAFAPHSSLRCNQALLEFCGAALVRSFYWNCILRLAFFISPFLVFAVGMKTLCTCTRHLPSFIKSANWKCRAEFCCVKRGNFESSKNVVSNSRYDYYL